MNKKISIFVFALIVTFVYTYKTQVRRLKNLPRRTCGENKKPIKVKTQNSTRPTKPKTQNSTNLPNPKPKTPPKPIKAETENSTKPIKPKTPPKPIKPETQNSTRPIKVKTQVKVPKYPPKNTNVCQIDAKFDCRAQKKNQCPEGYVSVCADVPGYGAFGALTLSKEQCAEKCRLDSKCIGFEHFNFIFCNINYECPSVAEHSAANCYVKDIKFKKTSEHKCADERGWCNCNGKVKFGKNEKWTKWRDNSGNIYCDRKNFEDPYPWRSKECICMNTYIY